LGATDSTTRTTTSTSYVTGSNTLSVTITPSATSSKFAIFVNHYTYKTDGHGTYTIYRNSTNLGGTDGLAYYFSNSGVLDGSRSYCFLDSPNTTSAITYQAYMRNNSATGTIYMGSNNMTAQIIVMEIKG
jgi:hypothetical protein